MNKFCKDEKLQRLLKELENIRHKQEELEKDYETLHNERYEDVSLVMSREVRTGIIRSTDCEKYQIADKELKNKVLVVITEYLNRQYEVCDERLKEICMELKEIG